MKTWWDILVINNDDNVIACECGNTDELYNPDDFGYFCRACLESIKVDDDSEVTNEERDK